MLDVPLPVDQYSDLSPQLVRKLRQLPRKIAGDDLRRRYPALVDLLKSPQLVWLQARCSTLDLSNRPYSLS